MQELGYGRGYEYDHDAPERFSGQSYFPDGMERQTFYRPTEKLAEGGAEGEVERFAELRRKRAAGG